MQSIYVFISLWFDFCLVCLASLILLWTSFSVTWPLSPLTLVGPPPRKVSPRWLCPLPKQFPVLEGVAIEHPKDRCVCVWVSLMTPCRLCSSQTSSTSIHSLTSSTTHINSLTHSRSSITSLDKKKWEIFHSQSHTHTPFRSLNACIACCIFDT